MKPSLLREAASDLIQISAVRSVSIEQRRAIAADAELVVEVYEDFGLIGTHRLRSGRQVEQLRIWIDKQGRSVPDECICRGHFMEVGAHMAACPC